jgi:hypothetical protein
VSSKSLLWIVALASLGFAGSASAESGPSSTLLYGTPTSDVLPVGTLVISSDMSLPLGRTAAGEGREENASIRFSPYRHLDFAIAAYTLADYVLDVKYQLAGGPGRLGLAVGVSDLGLNRYVSPIGHGTASVWSDWRYQANNVMVRPYEDLSAFAVASYRATPSIRLHGGIGRGRFVGYGDLSRYFNTDVLFQGHHQWAVGLFGGAEVLVVPQVALVAEASGRDVNAGLRASFNAIAATIAWTKMEGLLRSEGRESHGRLEVSLSYRFHDWTGISGLVRPRRPAHDLIQSAPTPTVLAPTPCGVTVSPNVPWLEPVRFDWGSWKITPDAASALARNAETLLGRPQAEVVLIGHASEGGSPEANCLLSGKRARAVFEYLKSRGVPEHQMHCRSRTLSGGEHRLACREVCFDTETSE